MTHSPDHPNHPTRPRWRKSIVTRSQRLSRQILAAKRAGDHDVARAFLAQLADLNDWSLARVKNEIGR